MWHLGKLVRDLPFAPELTVVYASRGRRSTIGKITTSENRALPHPRRRSPDACAVRHGYYLRSQNPLEQTVEVLRRFELGSILSPFSRCLRFAMLYWSPPKRKR